MASLHFSCLKADPSHPQPTLLLFYTPFGHEHLPMCAELYIKAYMCTQSRERLGHIRENIHWHIQTRRRSHNLLGCPGHALSLRLSRHRHLKPAFSSRPPVFPRSFSSLSGAHRNDPTKFFPVCGSIKVSPTLLTERARLFLVAWTETAGCSGRFIRRPRCSVLVWYHMPS